jgi:hypothetical protein
MDMARTGSGYCCGRGTATTAQIKDRTALLKKIDGRPNAHFCVGWVEKHLWSSRWPQIPRKQMVILIDSHDRR